MIYYSDGSCSEEVDASKTAIGIVVKDNELIVTLNVPNMKWSSNQKNVSGITDITDSSVAKQDYNGKANTLAILETFPSNTISNNAAIFCNSYSTEGTNAGDWYLPAAGEVYDYIYTNYVKVKAGWDKVGTTISNNYFCSSSEYSANYIWYFITQDCSIDWRAKDGKYSVTCFLAL